MTQDTAKPQLSIVAPCFNEEAVLHEFYQRVSATCEATGLDYEIVLVNDGSSDSTWQMMRELSAKDDRMVIVNLSRNHGHQLALSAGLQVCRGDRILILDADLQDPPELLPDMMKVMDDGVDVVYAVRKRRQGVSIFKRMAYLTFYRILGKLSETKIPYDSGDFRLITRRVLEILNDMPERHRFLRGMISWSGFRQEPFEYDRPGRAAGETKYSMRRLMALALDGVTAFSVKPLALASIAGVIMAIFAMCLLGYAIISWIFDLGNLPPGWTSLMAAISILGAVQLLALGIIGEYLGRLYEQAKGRPLYIIDEIVRGDTSWQPSLPDIDELEKTNS